jgi:hypothetical protein
MKQVINIWVLLLFLFLCNSCVDQESILNDRYLNLEEPRYYGDTVRMLKILKIHKKLLRKQPDNFIYLSNVFQMNCSLGKFKENAELIENAELLESSNINPSVYKNFYLALNAYREDRNSNYEFYLSKLNDEDMTHNPLLGYIAARCTGEEELSNLYFPLMLEYVRFMPEKITIMRMIESDKCENFLLLYKGICPQCETLRINRYI